MKNIIEFTYFSVLTVVPDKRAMDLITSMPEQGMSLSLVWHWHVRTGSSPDQAYGAQPAREANVNEV